jgi:diguanylate cyclase (GGDEF)-like protein
MRRSPVSLFLLTLLTSVFALAQLPRPTLTSLTQIHSSTISSDGRGSPVAFAATVGYYRGRENMLFVQDDSVGIYVRAPANAGLVPGDRVFVRGTTRMAFRLFIMGDTVVLLHHGPAPKPAPADFDQLIRAQHDCVTIKVRAIVRAADAAWGANGPTYLQLLTPEGYLDAVLDSDDAAARSRLLDSEVEITGVASAKLDGKNESTGVKIFIPSLANISILKPGAPSPVGLTPLNEIFSVHRVDDRTQRVRVRGTLTYYQPGSFAVLQDGPRTLRVTTLADSPLHVGDLVEATGFPDLQNGFLCLTRAEIEDTGKSAPILPVPATWQGLTASEDILDLVSIQGVLVMEVRGTAQDEYVLVSDGYLFSAIYRHPDAASQSPLPPMKQIPIGSKVRVSGICVLKDSNPFNGQVPFDLLLRSPADIAVVASPSPLTVRNLSYLSGALLLLIIAAAAWNRTLTVKVRSQTSALAARIHREVAEQRMAEQIHRKRSLILEAINSLHPLPDIIEKTIEMVSLQQSGSCCWFVAADGKLYGNPPPQPLPSPPLEERIVSRPGAPLGTIFLERGDSPAAESEVLVIGARMLTLAFENRQLYNDLHHRSEFDLLTDLPNRFNMEKHLHRLLDQASAGIASFGLIYVDLDLFKQINDRYGHHVGDLYLQEAARRMKLQLRAGDLLARIGGDEFIVLVPILRTRTDAEEISLRIERCFEAPFKIEGLALRGGASLGLAVCPDDGLAKAALVRFADQAMYKNKQARREIASALLNLSPAPG